jgi:transposase
MRNVCRQFIVLCRELELFSEAIVAIDGSKFKAVNNRDKNFTPAKMKRRLVQIEESIARYLTAMDTADRNEPDVAKLKKDRLQEKISALKQQMQGAEGAGRENAGESRPAALAERSRCPLDEEP